MRQKTYTGLGRQASEAPEFIPGSRHSRRIEANIEKAMTDAGADDVRMSLEEGKDGKPHLVARVNGAVVSDNDISEEMGFEEDPLEQFIYSGCVTLKPFNDDVLELDLFKEATNKLVTIEFDGDFPIKVGSAMNYKREHVNNTGILIAVSPQKHSILMLLMPDHPEPVMIHLPRKILKIVARRPSSDNLLVWRSHLMGMLTNEERPQLEGPKA